MGYTETDDFFYIEAKLEQAITYVDNDDDVDISENQTGSSSIPISKTYKNPDIDSNEKVKLCIKKYLIHNKRFDVDDEQTTSIEGLVGQAKDYLLLSRER